MHQPLWFWWLLSWFAFFVLFWDKNASTILRNNKRKNVSKRCRRRKSSNSNKEINSFWVKWSIFSMKMNPALLVNTKIIKRWSTRQIMGLSRHRLPNSIAHWSKILLLIPLGIHPYIWSMKLSLMFSRYSIRCLRQICLRIWWTAKKSSRWFATILRCVGPCRQKHRFPCLRPPSFLLVLALIRA